MSRIVKYRPYYDKEYMPAIFEKMAFEEEAKKNGKRVIIALERENNLISIFKTYAYEEGSKFEEESKFFIERIVKTLLWLKGGFKIYYAGPRYIGENLKQQYCLTGERKFDAVTMERVYSKKFDVEIVDEEQMPSENENTIPVGRHLEGCRIGFDAGGSDRKVSAVIDGESVFSEEVVWDPKLNSNPEYHYNGILDSMKKAAKHMPRVDAIGISSAGIYVNNQVKIASLFLKVPEDLFDKKVKNIFIDIQKEMSGVPIQVANDGDVTALAGSMSLKDNGVLGIAMGTSEAGGYVNENGNITGWLNELAFAPVDFNKKAMVDEWSGDFGCGVKYFSQDGVIKLANNAGIIFEEDQTPAQKLKVVQKMLEDGEEKAHKIFESIGAYLGYTIPYYLEFYDFHHLLILGRVTSSIGGDIIISTAKKILEIEFPLIAEKLEIHIPDEYTRRVGQSIAAASLPKI